MNFTEEQIERYRRHIILEDVGVEGQWKISQSKVLIIGVGGLGSASALYLGAAGIGTLGIVDNDVVDMTNLQRQIIHATPDLDKPKVLSAKETLNAINPDVNVVTYQTFVTSENILNIIRDYDFVIDGTDNVPAKFLINDACVMAKKPFSHGGVLRFDGQTMTVIPGKTGCYRCIFIQPPPDAVPISGQVGILGAVAGMLGTIQAAEALKYILGIGGLLANRLLRFDALEMNFRTIHFQKNPECPICGDSTQITDLDLGTLFEILDKGDA